MEDQDFHVELTWLTYQPSEGESILYMETDVGFRKGLIEGLNFVTRQHANGIKAIGIR